MWSYVLHCQLTYLCRREKLSLGLARFKSLKSIQSLILSFFFWVLPLCWTPIETASSIPLFFQFLPLLWLNLWMSSSQLLLKRLVSSYQRYPMYYDIRIQTRHILARPGKNIYIIPEQCNQLFSFFKGDHNPYLQLSLNFFITHIYGFKFLSSGFPSLFMLFY